MNIEQILSPIVIGFVLGVTFSSVILAFWVKGRVTQVRARCRELETEILVEREKSEAAAIGCARYSAEASRIPDLERTIDDLRERMREADRENAQLATMLKAERQNHVARVEQLTTIGTELENKFAALASEALGKNRQDFLALVSERFEKHNEAANQDLEKRQKEIETLVKPLGENLDKFERKVEQIEKDRKGAYERISEVVESLKHGQMHLHTETARLVQALRQPKTRGRWGEHQLRNVLEMAGMTEHVDFLEQPTIQGENGQLRPDVIIRVPGGKSIIVDAKTPLDAYLAGVEAPDADARERHVARHARQVRQHIRNLASQEYWKALPGSPDFVVMFIPGEAFFAAAIESDPALFELAVRQRVLISTPTTLIALVKAIAYGWQQETLAANARTVQKLGGELFQRLSVFRKHMGDLGQALRQTVDRYNKGVGTLEGRILPAARKFEPLGVVARGTEIPVLEPVTLAPRAIEAARHAEPLPDRETAAGS